MDTKQSLINRAMGRQIRREQSVSMSVRELSEKTGISEATINRMWSKDPRDINITQITWLAALMGVTPQELVENAVKEAGGLEKIMSELQASLSEASDTNGDLVTLQFQREVDEMSPAEIEDLAIAATVDPERRTDEF